MVYVRRNEGKSFESLTLADSSRIAIKAVDLVTAEADTIVRLQREIQVRGQ
jgi:hypothetical protein